MLRGDSRAHALLALQLFKQVEDLRLDNLTSTQWYHGQSEVGDGENYR
jgi:hypothetical protein